MGKNTQKTIRRAGGGRGTEGGRENLTSREFSAGGIIFKDDKWLVAKSSASDLFPKEVWRFPKGHIEENEPIEQAALREVREESGVEAKIIKKIETIKYFFKHPEKGNIFKFVTFYLMEWQVDLPEGHDMETSEVAWLSFDEAYKRLSFYSEKKLLKKAKELL